MGLVVCVDSPSAVMEEQLSQLVTQHILERASGLPVQSPLAMDDLRQFLRVIWDGERRVGINWAAQQLLQAFYQASRRVRTSSVYCTDMPATAKDTMYAHMVH